MSVETSETWQENTPGQVEHGLKDAQTALFENKFVINQNQKAGEGLWEEEGVIPGIRSQCFDAPASRSCSLFNGEGTPKKMPSRQDLQFMPHLQWLGSKKFSARVE